MNKRHLLKSLPCISIYFVVTIFFLQACTQHHGLPSPSNPSAKFFGNKSEAGEEVVHQGINKSVFASDLDCREAEFSYKAVNYRGNKNIQGTEPLISNQNTQHIFNRDLPLSPGDLVDIKIEDGEGFSGQYIVNPDGSIKVPHLDPVKAAGLGLGQISKDIELALVRGEIFQPSTAKVIIQVLQLAAIEVAVSGAVFEPGRVRINESSNENTLDQRIKAAGDHSARRNLSEALRAASGIRPDAKLDQIILIRNGWRLQLDMSGVLSGNPSRDIALIDGDQVIVPSTGCFQSHLVRPSQITPKGFRVFMSNLIVPSESNANGAVGRFSSNLPYGTRLLQAAVSANCVGGIQLTNAPRKIILASKNPITGEIQVIERSVELLMRQAHREDINPYIMPNDALACYDSDVTNLRDFARTITELITPLKLLF